MLCYHLSSHFTWCHPRSGRPFLESPGQPDGMLGGSMGNPQHLPHMAELLCTRDCHRCHLFGVGHGSHKREKHLHGRNRDIWKCIYVLTDLKGIPTITKVKSHATPAETFALGQTWERGTLDELADAAADICTDHRGDFATEIIAVGLSEILLEKVCCMNAHIQAMCWKLDNAPPPVAKADVVHTAQVKGEGKRHALLAKAKQEIVMQESMYGHALISVPGSKGWRCAKCPLRSKCDSHSMWTKRRCNSNDGFHALSRARAAGKYLLKSDTDRCRLRCINPERQPEQEPVYHVQFAPLVHVPLTSHAIHTPPLRGGMMTKFDRRRSHDLFILQIAVTDTCQNHRVPAAARITGYLRRGARRRCFLDTCSTRSIHSHAGGSGWRSHS